MSVTLKQQLKELEKQREREVRHLHMTYLRTKREVKRTISPTRIARKHLGPTLGAAALVGFLIAPGAKEKDFPGARKPAGHGMLGKLFRKMYLRVAPHFGVTPPPPADAYQEGLEQGRAEAWKEAEKAAKQQVKPKKRGLLEGILALALSKVDLKTLMPMILGKTGSNAPANGKHDGREPDIAVADAGTVKPSDYDDLQ